MQSHRVSQSKFRRRHRLNGGALFAAILVQGVILVVTIFVVVLDPPKPEAPRFEGQPVDLREEESVDRLRRLDQFRKRVSKPRSLQRLSAKQAMSQELPALPEMPVDAFDVDPSSDMLMEDAQSMLEHSGLLGKGSYARAASSQAAFFGVQDSGKRIVLVVNTSASVVRKAREKGVSIDAIHDEAIALIDNLEGGTLFGIVQFSQGSRRFSPFLAPAIKRNKEAASSWVRAEMRGNPPVDSEELLGHEAGLASAIEMEPDLIFLVTDGVLNKRIRDDGKYKYPEIPYEILMNRMREEIRSSGARTRVHAIGFDLKDKDRRGLERLTRAFGGTLREF